ncbi:MAG: hypothetical protein R3C10_11500 [Pirellulales bacterium]
MTFFVAVDGNDAWSGRKATANAAATDGPFATIGRARDAIRELRSQNSLPEGAVVTIAAGTYVIEAPLEFTSEDSGSADAPIEYRAAAGELVRLLGGRIVEPWRPVADEAVLDRLDPAALDHVVVEDLKALGVSDFGSPAGGGLEVFCDGAAMTLARWPNDDFVRIVDVLGATENTIHGNKGRVEGIFRYDGDRPSRWAAEADAWVHGYWFWDWSEQRHKVKAIDAAEHVIEVEPPYHGYGYRKGQWFYGFNLLSEIDQPGEWYVDRAEGKLYFWPPAPLDHSEVLVSVIPTLISMNDVSHVTSADSRSKGCGTRPSASRAAPHVASSAARSATSAVGPSTSAAARSTASSLVTCIKWGPAASRSAAATARHSRRRATSPTTTTSITTPASSASIGRGSRCKAWATVPRTTSSTTRRTWAWASAATTTSSN